MTITELLLAELEREAPATRRTLQRVPEGRGDWRPHPKSMSLGRLSQLVAGMPSWITMMLHQDELDVNPVGGKPPEPTYATNAELVAAFDAALDAGRAALRATTDEYLLTTWTLKSAGHVISEQQRHIAISDGVLNHLAHHRGQLTVYLRLTDASVPSVYGPSADEMM